MVLSRIMPLGDGDDGKYFLCDTRSRQKNSSSSSARHPNKKQFSTDNVGDGVSRSHGTDHRHKSNQSIDLHGNDNRRCDDGRLHHDDDDDSHHRDDHHHDKHVRPREAAEVDLTRKHPRKDLSKSENGSKPGLSRVQGVGLDEVWVCRDLMVRIVDRHYRRGRYYNTKVSCCCCYVCLPKALCLWECEFCLVFVLLFMYSCCSGDQLIHSNSFYSDVKE